MGGIHFNDFASHGVEEELNDGPTSEYDFTRMKADDWGTYFERIKREGFKIVLLGSDEANMLRTDGDDNLVSHPPAEIAERNNGGESKQETVTTDATP